MGTPTQEYVCSIADGAPVTNSFSSASKTFPLPDLASVKVVFSRPKKGSYSQDFMLGFPKGSATPFIFAAPSAAVETVK
jgi:hypothetical protein